MAGNRKLVIEILGNAKDGAKALLDVRDNADKMSEGLQKAGGVGVAAGTALGGGLLWAATQAAEADTQSRKLDNSIANSSNTFRNNGQALRDLAQATQGKTAADGDAIVGMQSLLVQYGYTEDQVLAMTPLVVDLSRKMGIDLDAAAKAVAKSADGSGTALKRMGIDVDETKLKADPFAATMEALASTVGGFAEEEGQTFAGELERMKNQLGDIVEGVGGGAIEVFGGIADAVSGVVGPMSAASGETGNLVGKIGAIGSLAAVGLGGLALVAGKAIELRNTFSDANGQLTRTGEAIKGLAVGVAVIGGIIALDTVMKNLTESSVDLQTNLDRLRAAENTAASFDALIERTRELDGGWEDMVDTFSQTGDLDRYADFGGVTVDLNNLDEALEQIRSSGDLDALDMALKSLSERKLSGEEMGVDRAKQILDKYRDSVDAARDAQDKQKGSTDQAAQAMTGMSGETEQATSALEEYTNAVRAGVDPLFGVLDAQDQVTAAKKRADEAMASGDLAAFYQATLDVAQAQFNLEGKLGSLKTAVDNGSVSIDVAKSALQRWVGQGILTQAQADAVASSFGGATIQAVQLDNQNPYVSTGTNAGDTAWAIAQAKAAAEKLDDQTYWINVQARFNYTPGQLADAMRYNAAAAYGRRALGGPVTKNLPYIVGEEGWELFVPDTSGTIVSNKDSRKLAASAISGGGASGLVIQNVNVDVSGQTDPARAGREFVDAILNYARTSGFRWPVETVPAG